MIQSLRDQPYHSRLRQLNLPSLVYRRRRGDMILIYQIMYQLLNIPSSAFFTPSSYTSTRGHNLKLLKPFSRCRSRQLFFLYGLSMIVTVYQPTLSMLPL